MKHFFNSIICELLLKLCFVYSKPDLDFKSTTDKDTRVKQAPTMDVDIAVDNSSLMFDEGDTMTLKWKLSGIYEN